MKQGRGKPKIILVKNDMSIKGIIKNMTSNRIKWWNRIHMLLEKTLGPKAGLLYYCGKKTNHICLIATKWMFM